MAELVTGELGPEVKYELKFEDMALKFEIKRVGGMGDEQGMYGRLPAGAVVDALFDGLEKLIPGDQKQMAEMAKLFIKGVLPK